MLVVGTMFFNDNKLLIDKPRKRSTYQMVGGGVEDGETPLQAAIRECYEELGSHVELDERLFELVMDFDEIATSDPNKKIHFYVFEYKGKLNLTFSKFVLKPALATVIMGICSYFVYFVLNGIIIERLATIIAILVAVIIYVLSVIVLKIFSKDELKMLPAGDKIVKVLEKTKIY